MNFGIKKTKDDFKKLNSFETRSNECQRILAKYKNKIPVIAQAIPNTNIQPMKNNKFLVPGDINIGQFIYVIRKRLVLDSSQAIYIFDEKNQLPPINATLRSQYEENKNEDGFLYYFYGGESTFGNSN